MQPDAPQNGLLALFSIIRARLTTAHSTADAAGACTTTNNYYGAFRVLLDIEQPVHEASAFLDAACLLRLEHED